MVAFMNVNHVPEVAALKDDDKTKNEMRAGEGHFSEKECLCNLMLRLCFMSRFNSIKCLTLFSHPSNEGYIL